MPTYAEYVVGAAQNAAQSALRQLSDENLLSTSEDDLVELLFAQLALPPVTLREDVSVRPVASGDIVTGAVVSIGFEGRDPERFFEFTASTHHSHPALTVSGDRIEFEIPRPRSAEDVQGVVNRVRENVARLDRDITMHDPQLRAHLTNQVAHAQRQAKQRRDQSEQAMEALRGSGFRIDLEDADADPDRGPSPIAGAAASHEPPAEHGQADASPELLAAVQLVSATAPTEVKLRAIAQVRGLVVKWADSDDERRLFANILLAGLDELTAYVREESEVLPASLLESVRINVDHAIHWATTNQRFRLALDLAAVYQFFQQVAGGS